MTAVPFPILRLPQRAFQKCLRQMSSVEHISLSVLSGNISKRIELLHKKTTFSSLVLEPSIALILYPFAFQYLDFDFKPDQMKLKLGKLVNGNFEFTEQNVPGFTLKQLFEHAVRVFIQNKQVRLSCPPESSIKEVYEHIKELKITTLTVESLEIRDCQLLKMFPLLENLSVSGAPIRKSILTQNFKELNLRRMKVTLDDILISNCSQIFINHFLSDNELNIFIKQWIRGSNPRLQKFSFHPGELRVGQFVEAQIFKEINYTEIHSYFGRYFEIQRNDGTKAHVGISKTDYIWFCLFLA